MNKTNLMQALKLLRPALGSNIIKGLEGFEPSIVLILSTVQKENK